MITYKKEKKVRKNNISNMVVFILLRVLSNLVIFNEVFRLSNANSR